MEHKYFDFKSITRDLENGFNEVLCSFTEGERETLKNVYRFKTEHITNTFLRAYGIMFYTEVMIIQYLHRTSQELWQGRRDARREYEEQTGRSFDEMVKRLDSDESTYQTDRDWNWMTDWVKSVLEPDKLFATYRKELKALLKAQKEGLGIQIGALTVI